MKSSWCLGHQSQLSAVRVINTQQKKYWVWISLAVIKSCGFFLPSFSSLGEPVRALLLLHIIAIIFTKVNQKIKNCPFHGAYVVNRQPTYAVLTMHVTEPRHKPKFCETCHLQNIKTYIADHVKVLLVCVGAPTYENFVCSTEFVGEEVTIWCPLSVLIFANGKFYRILVYAALQSNAILMLRM